MHSATPLPLAQSSEAAVSSRPSLSYWQDAWLRLQQNKRAIFFAVSDYRIAAVYLCRAVCLDSRPIRSGCRPNQHRTRCRPLGDLGRRLSTLVWGTKQWLCAQRQRSRLNLCSCHLHPSGTFGLARPGCNSTRGLSHLPQPVPHITGRCPGPTSGGNPKSIL